MSDTNGPPEILWESSHTASRTRAPKVRIVVRPPLVHSANSIVKFEQCDTVDAMGQNIWEEVGAIPTEFFDFVYKLKKKAGGE